MKLLETLKWLWDPRSEEDRAHAKWEQETPLQRCTQEVFVYIRDREEPLCCHVMDTDIRTNDWTYRRASKYFDDTLNKWLAERGTKGIRVDSVWYSPEVILRIELGESVLEAIE